MNHPVGIVLAGGQSRRMGRDKTRIEIDGETLAARAARHLHSACAEVAVADAGRSVVPGLPSLPDGPGAGPAAGLLGAAAAYPSRPLLALACDLPDIPPSLLARLAEEAASSTAVLDWIVPRWSGRIEPLCAVYFPAALQALDARVRADRFDLTGLAETSALRIRYWGEGDLAPFGDPVRLFANLNRPEDFERWDAEGGVGSGSGALER
jgi:molybdopterin-guanine dinucleotide biosynthesis protein A